MNARKPVPLPLMLAGLAAGGFVAALCLPLATSIWVIRKLLPETHEVQFTETVADGGIYECSCGHIFVSFHRSPTCPKS